MAKIKNPTLFSSQFQVSKKKLLALGIFDPMLNVDTNLFIDPVLLNKSFHPVISKEATAEYRDHFERIILLLRKSKTKGDVAWRAAKRMLYTKEVQGTCLGYGTNSISGRSLSQKIQEEILATAKEIVDLGIEDPELFMLLPLFEEGVGPDTISDFTTSVVENSLLKFTSLMAKELGIQTITALYDSRECDIIPNPKSKKVSPVILLPLDILRHLPIVTSWSEISEAASFNLSLRGRVNRMIAEIWRARTRKEKLKKKREMLKDKAILQDLISVIKKGKVTGYDFEKDERSIVAWHKILDTIQVDYPRKISVTSSSEGLNRCIKTILDQFKFLVQEKGLNKLLWHKREPNREKVSQLLFFAVAISYCKANDIDINPEMDSGTGLIDFKFSKGYSKRCIVEVKLSNNPRVVHGYTKQIEMYKNSEETDSGYFLILDVGGIGKKLDSIIDIQNKDDKKFSDIIYIDGRLKSPASKRK